MKHFLRLMYLGAAIFTSVDLIFMWFTDSLPSKWMLNIWGIYFALSAIIIFFDSLMEDNTTD